MTGQQQPRSMPDWWVTFCKRPLTVCTTVVLLFGIIFVYAGVGTAFIQCREKDMYDVKYYNWNCKAYYTPDFVYISFETCLVIITALLLALGQRKTLRFPIMAFLTIMSVFMIMGIQKYGNEYPGRGLFLKPRTESLYGNNYYSGKIFSLKKTRSSHDYYDDDDDNYHDDIVKTLEVMELKGVYTHEAPRKLVTCGYSFIVVGNLVLLLVVGVDQSTSVALPSLGKYKKTVDRFRSHLAAMIAPDTKPLSEDEEEKLVQREMDPV